MRRMMRSGLMEPNTDDTTSNLPRDAGAGQAVSSHAQATARSSAGPDEQLPDAVVDELFSILSHELRAPLTTIKGASRTLLRHGAVLDSAASRQLLSDIDQEADRLHRLVDNLLELARAGIGRHALRAEPTAID